jgi:hypothetical protein
LNVSSNPFTLAKSHIRIACIQLLLFHVFLNSYVKTVKRNYNFQISTEKFRFI